MIEHHTARKEAVSIGLCGNAAEIVPELARRAKAGGIRPDIVTDQTSAHDIINGYLPIGWTVAQWQAAQKDPAQHARLTQAAGESCATHVQGDAGFPRDGRAHRGLRQQPAPGRQGLRRRRRLRLPGLRACVYPAAVLPRRRPVPLGRAVRRPGGHPQDRRQDEGAVPREQAPAPLAGHGRASASATRACRRASAGSAWASGTWRAWPSTRWSRAASSRRPS